VKLEPNGEKAARLYLEAKPGRGLESGCEGDRPPFGPEISRRKDAVPVKSRGTGAPDLTVAIPGLSGEGTCRHRTLRTSRRASPDRERRTDPAIKQMKLLAKYVPSVHARCSIIRLPRTARRLLKNISTGCIWTSWTSDVCPVSPHALPGSAKSISPRDRHYYTSHDYNSLQQGVTALPTKDGTLVITLAVVSTEPGGRLCILDQT